MYIAFKWLFVMGVTMWVIMCCCDEYKQRRLENSMIKIHCGIENISDTKQVSLLSLNQRKYQNVNSRSQLRLYFILLTSFMITLFYHKREHLLIYINEFICKIILQYEKFDKDRLVGMIKIYLNNWREHIIEQYVIFKACMSQSNMIEEHVLESSILINKLKEINEERKNLSHMLRLTMEEKDTFKQQLKLENVAKDRLLKHIQEMNKQIKENKTKYFNFQSLYVATHQENIFLKCRLKRLSKEKQAVEQNLMNLVQKVYESKNVELLNYCSRFIVHTRENLINADVKDEIKTFLKKTYKLRGIGKNGCSITELNGKVGESTKLIEINEENDWDDPINCIVGSLHNYDNCENTINDSSAGDYQNVCGNMENTLVRIPLKHNFLTQSEAFMNFLKVNESRIA